LSLRGVVDFFVFDPSDPKVLYAHATGLWRSTDGGEHWNLIYPKPSARNWGQDGFRPFRRGHSCPIPIRWFTSQR